MSNHQRFIAALALLTSAFSTQAHDINPGGKIIVTCQAGRTPRSADIAYAVERSNYWATHGARREMLTLARQSCSSGSAAVNFIPPPDQR
jgi:hypothetical protein